MISKTSQLIVYTAGIFLLVTACAPNAKQLKEIIEKDPSIVFTAIEKDPEGFFEMINRVNREVQQKNAEKMQKEEQENRENEFKNPLNPEIGSDRAILGPKETKITIVEYTDMKCPYCARGHKTLKEVLNAYPQQVRIVTKHLPLDLHSVSGAKYFEAIAKQSHEMAYKFKSEVFENQSQFREQGEKFLEAIAKKIGVNMAKLKKDLDSPEIMSRIQKDISEAQKFNITGTPGFIINGVSLKGAYPFSAFKEIIDRHLQN